MKRIWKFIRRHPIGRRAPLRCWTRWLAWQIRSRVVSGPHHVDWIEGLTLVAERGMTGATGNIYCGLHEFADMALVLHFLGGYQSEHPDACFLDVGANIGSYTLLAAGIAQTSTLSIEPAPTTFAKLVRNVQANELEPRVRTVCVAVGSHAGELRFSVDRDTENKVVDDSYYGVSTIVPVVTLDSLTNNVNVVAIKMDVEGFEKEVLTGATRLLHQATLQLVLLESDDSAVRSIMHDAGFEPMDYDPWTRRVLPDTAKPHLGNHLWLRDQSVVQQVCARAGHVSVCGLDV